MFDIDNLIYSISKGLERFHNREFKAQFPLYLRRGDTVILRGKKRVPIEKSMTLNDPNAFDDFVGKVGNTTNV